MKSGVIDLKNTQSDNSPDIGYVRIRATDSGVVQLILDDGTIKNISSPWELPVENNTVTDPSALSPSLWNRYIVAEDAIGDWTGQDDNIAQWNGAGWEFITPEHGWIVYVKSDNLLWSFDGVDWVISSGGGSTGGVYTEEFIIGGSNPTYTVNHELESKNLNITAYEVPSYNKISLESTNDSMNTTTFYGDGEALLVRVILDVGGGSMEGITPFDAIEVTYSDLTTIIGNMALKIGNYYKITDFRTVNDAGLGMVNTAQIEEIIVQAISENVLDQRAYSAEFMYEILYYNINNTGESTHGVITYRENLEQNIKTVFDFRGCQFARVKLDPSSLVSWSSGTTYTTSDIVLYNDTLWKPIHNTGNVTTEAPGTNRYWVKLFEEVSHNYTLFETTSGWASSLTLDVGSYKLFPVFGQPNISGETSTFNINQFTNITCNSNNVIFMSTSGTHDNITVERYCDGLTIASKNISKAYFGSGSNNTSTSYSGYIYNGIFSDGIKNSSIDKIDGVNIRKARNSVLGSVFSSDLDDINTCYLQNINRCQFGAFTRQFYGGDISNTIVGIESYNNEVVYSSYNTFGMRFENNKIETVEFRNNVMGNYFRRFIIPETISFFSNTFGNEVGHHSIDFIVNSHWYRNKFGDMCFSHGGSSIGGMCTYVTVGSNLYNLNVGGDFQNSSFGSGCRDINVTNGINGVNIGSSCGLFNLGGHFSRCNIADGCLNITVPSGVNLNMVDFGVGSTNIDFTGATSSSHIAQSYNKEIITRVDTSKVLRYTDNLNTLIYDSIIG